MSDLPPFQPTGNPRPAPGLFEPRRDGWGDYDWSDAAAWCDYCRIRLTPREAAFIRNLRLWRGQPSYKQLDWLDAIFRRLGGDHGRR